jgi:hypothetical protein
MEINFDISLEQIRPLYFHFLDGYLNPKFGSNLKVVKNLIINLIFINSLRKCKLCLFGLRLRTTEVYGECRRLDPDCITQHTPIAARSVPALLTLASWLSGGCGWQAAFKRAGVWSCWLGCRNHPQQSGSQLGPNNSWGDDAGRVNPPESARKAQ